MQMLSRSQHEKFQSLKVKTVMNLQLNSCSAALIFALHWSLPLLLQQLWGICLNSVTDTTPEEFISQFPEKESKYNQLKKLLSEIISVQLENVHIFSVLKSSQTRGVDVWFAVYGPPYYKAEKLNGNVAASRAWVSAYKT